MAIYELDTRRLLCPMPVIKTQNKVRELCHHDTLTVIATDPGALHDLPCWSRMNGHQIISCQMVEGEVHMTIQIIKDNE